MFNLRHDSVAEGEESEKLLTELIVGLECVGEGRVVELEGGLMVGVAGQVNYAGVLW